MRLLLVACLVASYAAEGQSWVPDLQEQDKRGHVALGIVAAALTDGALSAAKPILPEWTQRPWVRRLAPTVGACVVGVAKEVSDTQDQERHTVDPGDAVATGIGGAGYSLAFCWRF